MVGKDKARKRKRRGEMVNMIVEQKTRNWSGFPIDLLVEILGHLLFIDHLSFRGVCKAWRSASLQSPPQNQSAAQTHWLIFSKKSSTSRSTWEFGDSSTRRLYTIDIPELTGIKTKCLLSTHGWLLLAHLKPPSIFFFNPFSRARIDLPWNNNFYHCYLNKRKKPAFALSSPPTSQDCTIFSVAFVDLDTFQISTCRRGEEAWTTKNYKRKRHGLFPIKSAVSSAGILYWVDDPGFISAFQPQKGTWNLLERPKEVSDLDLFENFYSYLMEWDGHVCMCLYFRRSGRRHYVILEIPHGDGSMAKMMVLGRRDRRYRVKYYGKEVTYMPGWLRPDTFSVGACCVSCDSEDDHGHKLFSWHLFYKPGCRKNRKNCDCKKAVWIQPIWINPSPSIAWTA